MRSILLFFCFSSAMLLCGCAPVSSGPNRFAAAIVPIENTKIKGLTLVAPPDSFPANPMPEVLKTGANWIAVVPYAFTPPNQSTVRYNVHGMQWWGERPEGVRASLRLAHEAGIHAMLKPQVWMHGQWTGQLQYGKEEDWQQWEAAYTDYILLMARIAEEEKAGLFCIGTEFCAAIQQRPQYWSALIAQVRKIYKGKLVYSANWDDWEKVPFWDQLDYIGMGGYYPLVQADTPQVAQLTAAWQPIKAKLKDFSNTHHKPILFTEYGYLSVDGAGWRNWELETGIENRSINQQAQANGYTALFDTFGQENWWAGGFLWKWFPNMQGHEGYPERDYTPQGKLGEKVLSDWFLIGQ